MTVNTHKGSSFDSFLEEELLESTESIALKKVIAYPLEKRWKMNRISKIEMATKLHTSRSTLDRLLDPENTSVTLNTLAKTAYFLGKLHISLR